jgi:hypothetical protein
VRVPPHGQVAHHGRYGATAATGVILASDPAAAQTAHEGALAAASAPYLDEDEQQLDELRVRSAGGRGDRPLR